MRRGRRSYLGLIRLGCTWQGGLVRTLSQQEYHYSKKHHIWRPCHTMCYGTGVSARCICDRVSMQKHNWETVVTPYQEKPERGPTWQDHLALPSFTWRCCATANIQTGTAFKKGGDRLYGVQATCATPKLSPLLQSSIPATNPCVFLHFQ